MGNIQKKKNAKLLDLNLGQCFMKSVQYDNICNPANGKHKLKIMLIGLLLLKKKTTWTYIRVIELPKMTETIYLMGTLIY